MFDKERRKNLIVGLIFIFILLIAILDNLIEFYWSLESNSNRIALLSLIGNGVIGVVITGSFSFLIWQSNKKSNVISKELKEINKKQYNAKRGVKSKLKTHIAISFDRIIREVIGSLKKQKKGDKNIARLINAQEKLKEFIENHENVELLDTRALNIGRDSLRKINNILNEYDHNFNDDKAKKFFNDCKELKNEIEEKVENLYSAPEDYY